ncbi:MAG TPA: GntR family transcriptional regulator [Terriglobales bacterium]|nr:GntR family transcriptional regulator [Terriglobales bacterium]
MRYWFAHNTAATLREQLAVQIVTGILSGDLEPGERLPSTREMARRYRLHANTVSAGYQQLVREGWLETRRGSGVFVRRQAPDTAAPPELALAGKMVALLREAKERGVPAAHVRRIVERCLARQAPSRVLVVEPREDLRSILMFEIAAALAGRQIDGCGFDGVRERGMLDGALVVALARHAAAARGALPEETELLTLRTRSVPAALALRLPLPPAMLIGVASRWPPFVRIARSFLLAAGVADECLLLRDARRPQWQRGLDAAAAVVCDASIAATANGWRALPFPLLAPEALAPLRQSLGL